MGRWNVRLLTVTYRRVEDDKLSIEMYGQLDDGRSIVARYIGFEPYFHLLEPDDTILSSLKDDPNVRRIEHISLFHRNQLRDAAKIVVRFPWLVPDFRSRLRRQFEVLAADIPFHHRFIYDYDLGSCIQIVGEEVSGNYTTDLVIDVANKDGRPDISTLDPFNPTLKIMSFDIENSVRNGNIFVICYVIREDGNLREGEPIQGTEKEIIEKFTKIIQCEDPDVITGYNIDNYDIPTVMDRAKACGADACRWGRDFSEPRRSGRRNWKIDGRLVVDAWWAAKIALRPKQETLNHVAKLVLGEEKIDVDPSQMDEEWERNPDRVMEYCLKDARLALEILEHIDTLRRTMDLSAVSKLPMEDVLSSGNSTLIDSILIREADRVPAPYGPVGVPMTSYSSGEDAPIEGGYVHTIEPGLYHWVIVLDFKSMYPSLIISKNICFTTLSDEGEIIAPNGARFLSKNKRAGLLPHILSELMGQRDEIKKRMRAATDPDERQYYDGLQDAVKILMNAFYGVFASSFYRFTDHSIGSAITSFARETVKTLIKRLEENDHEVIYGDSVTADRFVTLLDPEGIIRVRNIEDLFEKHIKSAKKRGDKDVINLQGYQALSMLPSGRSTWSAVTEIIRHRSNKKIYRVNQRLGESRTTEDHSFLIWKNDLLKEAKPVDMLENSMIRVDEIPPVEMIETLDMYELLSKPNGNFIACAEETTLKRDDKYVWFADRKGGFSTKLKRFIKNGSIELEALCKVLSIYISSGNTLSSNDSRNKVIISTPDKEQLEEFYKCCERLFVNQSLSVAELMPSVGMMIPAEQYGSAILHNDYVRELRIIDQIIVALFERFCGAGDEEKKLPEFIFHIDEKYKKIVLEGIMRVRGSYELSESQSQLNSVDEIPFRYETKSLQLTCGISLLLSQLAERYEIVRDNNDVYHLYRAGSSNNLLVDNKVEEEEYYGYVYDLSIEKTHAFVDSCGQILLHNTDSLFVQSPNDELNATVEFGTEVSERFSKEISAMEFEKVFESLFSHGKKKRYVGRSVWPVEETIVRGYEIRRTDSFELQSRVLSDVFEKILDGTPEEGVRVARETVSRVLSGDVPVEELVISRTCKPFSAYKDPDSQANVQTAKKLMALGYDFIPGMKVSWIVTDSKKTPQEVEPYISGRPFEHKPDWQYYASRIAQTAARATEVFGWGERDLMTGSQQATLFDTTFYSPTPSKSGEKPKKSAKKNLDLRDFM